MWKFWRLHGNSLTLTLKTVWHVENNQKMFKWTRCSPSSSCCSSRQVAPVVSDSVQRHRWQPTRLPHPQARTLEWVAISLSSAWKWKVKVKSLSRVRLFATPWTAAYQAPPSIGFSRQEYWSGGAIASSCRSQNNPGICQHHSHIPLHLAQDNPFLHSDTLLSLPVSIIMFPQLIHLYGMSTMDSGQPAYLKNGYCQWYYGRKT